MALSAMVGSAARLVATGLAGAAAYDGIKKVLHGRVVPTICANYSNSGISRGEVSG